MNRRERKAFHNENEKLMQKLLLRHEALLDAKYNLGYVELENPIRHGWVRYFVLRGDLKGRKDYKILQKLVEILNYQVHSNNRTFTSKYFRTKRLIKIEQPVKLLRPNEFEKLDEKERSYFSEIIRINKWSKQKEYLWEFKFPWMLVFRIRPYYITKVKLFDPEIDSELNRINKKLYSDDKLYYRYTHPGNNHYRDKKSQEQKNFRRIHSHLSEY